MNSGSKQRQLILVCGAVAVSIGTALPAISQPLAWKDLGAGRMQLLDQGKPALVYNYGPQLKPGAPEEKRRCCYLFPVYSPAGVSMLDDFPADHLHHRGLFWAWPVIVTGGKTYDGWMDLTVKDSSSQPPSVSTDTQEARLDARNFWQVDGKDIVREVLRLTVSPTKDGVRELQVDLTWEALSAPVTLAGSHETAKSYGGCSARFAPRVGTVLRADGEVLKKDEDLTPRKWAELEGVYGGKKMILRITPDPKNPGAPYQWCLRNYGFVGASFPGKTESVKDYTLEPGNPLRLQFQVRIADVP